MFNFKSIFFIFAFVISFFSLMSVDTLGIGLIIPQESVIYYEPGKVITLQYKVVFAEGKDVDVILKGELEKYAVVSSVGGDINSKYKPFTVTLTLPGILEPGVKTLTVGVSERPPSKGGISILTQVFSSIKVKVPYHGKYAELSFDVPDGNIDSYIDAKINIFNFGTEEIKNVKGYLEVFDFFNKSVKKIELNYNGSVNTFETKELFVRVDLTGFKKGEYRAVALVDLDGFRDVLRDNFNVGDLFLKVEDFTKVLRRGGIEPIIVSVKNDWSGAIEDSYMTVEVVGEKLKSATSYFDPFESKNITVYLDTKNINVGEYPIKFTLYFKERKSEFSSVVNIISAEEEKPVFLSKLGLLVIISLCLVIVLLVNLILVLLRLLRKKNKN